MSVQMVRFGTDPDQAPEVQQTITRLIGALTDAAPPGVAYSAYQVGEKPEFVLVLELADGTENPLPTIPEAVELRTGIAAWTGSPVPPEPATVIGRFPA